MSASLGVYCNAGHWDDTPDEMMARADDALYRAKETGRDQVIIFQDNDDTSSHPESRISGK